MNVRVPHVLAIPGSTREHSTHKALLRTIAGLAADRFTLDLYAEIDTLPHFNPDLDADTIPGTVARFRQLLREADGVLICTPEYAMGVPGTLKNAVDWTVSSAELYQKPTALITASSQGYKGHAALMETLRIIGCVIPEDAQIIIPFIKTKVAADGTITDAATLAVVQQLITSFHSVLIDTPAVP